MTGALLVAGTASDAGKSVVTAGLCRWLARDGVRVAPFKAQNMALNSTVTADGAEIGRAQAMQAAAAGVPAEAAMNPVLLKPGSDRVSQLVVLGRPVGEVDALGYRAHQPALLAVALDCLAGLRRRFDVVICEGAGSPAEINLRDSDLVNFGLARPAGLPVLLVADIDRGGALAGLYGTLALLDPGDQAQLAGYVINKFRGDPRLLAPGLDALAALTGRPTYGVLPWRSGLWLDAEDSLDLDGDRGEPTPARGRDVLRVSVLRLPRLSNVTDMDALAAEPGVLVRLASRPEQLADADLVVVPGTRSTVADLDWLHRRGLAAALVERARAGRPILGICGGYQMLGQVIDDAVESRRGRVPGLGLLPVRTRFAPEKTLGRPTGWYDAHRVSAYEIHHGVVAVTGGRPLFVRDPDAAGEGCRVGTVAGTVWHGALENDGFRRAYLAEVAGVGGRDWLPGDEPFAAARQRRLDALADLVADHLDTDAVRRLIEGGVPPGLPILSCGLRPAAAAAVAG